MEGRLFKVVIPAEPVSPLPMEVERFVGRAEEIKNVFPFDRYPAPLSTCFEKGPGIAADLPLSVLVSTDGGESWSPTQSDPRI